jgi:hypothetical protein
MTVTGFEKNAEAFFELDGIRNGQNDRALSPYPAAG